VPVRIPDGTRALVARPRLAMALAAGPDRVVQITVALALAAGVTVSLGQFRPWTVLPLAALVIAATWKAFRPRVDPRDAFPAALALGGSLAWALLNFLLTSEYLLVVRDPGFLTLSGLWLAHHPSTDIPSLGAIQAADVQSNMLADASQAWNLRGDMIQPQGAKMLPATIAMGDWVAGEWGVLGANIVVGAVGLLAVYILGRQFLGPRVALAPTVAVALTVSQVALSRSAYSEPLTMLFVLTGVTWAWRGLAERSAAMMLGGAAAIGATTFIRIDGAIFAAGAIAGIVIALALGDAPRRWRAGVAVGAVLLQGAVLAGGYLSLWRWSQAYADRLGGQTHSLILVYSLLCAVLLVWAATWLEPVRSDRLLTTLRARLGKRGALATGGAIVAGMLVLASRPLWTIVHRGESTSEDQFTNRVVAAFQQARGLPVDGTRTYAESTVSWISYYLTWPIVLLAILGLGIAATRTLRGRSEWAVLLGATLAPSLLYFWAPEIVPDQVWAIRRFEPMTIPALALTATLAAVVLARRLRREEQRARALRWSIGIVALLPVASWISIQPGADQPVLGATPLVIRELGGSRDQMHALCDVAPGHPIVLAGTSSHFGSLRVMCDEPVVLALVAPTPESLAAMAQIFGTTPVVLTRDTTWFEWTSTPSVVVTSTVRQSSYTLGGIPREYFKSNYSWYAGLVRASGQLTPIPPAGQ